MTSHTHTLLSAGTHTHSAARHTHSIGGGGSHSHTLPSDGHEFSVGDYVVFAACPGTLFRIESGVAPFWYLDYVGGPPLTPSYHETLFGEKPPAMPTVIEYILHPVNEMMVIAIMATEG